MVFVKHSAPNHMLAPILHIQPKALKITIDIKLIELKERKCRKLGGGGGVDLNLQPSQVKRALQVYSDCQIHFSASRKHLIWDKFT